MDAEALVKVLDLDGEVEQNDGGWWLRPPYLDVRRMATRMREHEVRLVTVTARPDADGRFRIIYHWDAGTTVLNVSICVAAEGGVPTIADIVPGADWAEREIRDYYDVRFTGRAETPTLMLRESDPAGLFARTGDLGRDTDPARTARAATSQEGESR